MAKSNDEPKKIRSDTDDEDIQDALCMMGKDSVIHNKHEGIWRAIQELIEAGFTVMNPTGTKKISSKMIAQILWKVCNKFKIPDFNIHRAGPFALLTDPEEIQRAAQIRELIEKVVTAGVGTVMKEGKFIQCMRDKGGCFYKSGLFGDSHMQVGYCEDNSDYPITFRVVSLSDFYVNSSATDIRDAVGGLSADSTVLIYRYTTDQFEAEWPEFKNKVAGGEIPRSYRYRKQLEKTWLQTIYDPQDIIEVAYYTSITGVQVVFAGSACTLLQKRKGYDEKTSDTQKPGAGEFPYVMDGKPYLNTLHFKFFPSSEGYYNYGIGHMIYDLAVLTQQMDNMAYNHAGDNIWPINFVNTPNKSASKLFNDILKAHEMRANGGKGYVVSANPPGQGSGVTIESFQSQPITQEWERAFHRLEQQVERFGFHLDAPDLGANPNEMSIMAYQENADEPIKQIIEWNASEFEMAVNMTINAIMKFVDDDDMTPLNSTVDFDNGDTKLPLRGYTLGMVAQELRANKYFVTVNARDGAIPSGVAEQARISKSMSTLIPGTKAWAQLNVEQAKLNGRNIKLEDVMPPQAGAAPQGAAPGAGQPIPTETSAVTAQSLKHPTAA